MADNELARKLARRQELMGENNESSNGNGHHQDHENGQRERPGHLHLSETESDTGSSMSGSQGGGGGGSHSPISDDASNELKSRLARRQDILDGKPVESQAIKVYPGLYAEFSEFTRKQLKQYEQMFKK